MADNEFPKGSWTVGLEPIEGRPGYSRAVPVPLTYEAWEKMIGWDRQNNVYPTRAAVEEELRRVADFNRQAYEMGYGHSPSKYQGD